MSVLPVGIGSSGGYEISRSVRFRSSATAYFNRTPASATNRTTWTWSGWVKRGSLTSDQVLFQGYSDANNFTVVLWDSSDKIQVQNRVAATATFNWVTTSVYRDPSAYYHVVVVFDTTQATSTNRIKIYVNGVEITAYTTQTTGSQNATGFINNTNGHNIGRSGAATQYFDGYLTETNFVDGQALTPSSFGEYDSITGVWEPKKYTGTYGTNGFYLNFSDNSAATAAAIGKDYSGNGNNWTPNNISVTAGVTYDSMLDTPTPFADGGNGRGNYATFSPIAKFAANASFTLTEGNLRYTQAVAQQTVFIGSTIALPYGSGKFYYEINQISKTVVGGDATTPFSLYIKEFASAGSSITNLSYYLTGNGNSGDPTGASLTGVSSIANNDVVMVAIDLVGGKLYLGKNNTWFNSGNPVASTGAVATNLANYSVFIPAVGNGGGNMTNFSCAINFGQRPFTYTPPSGFLALNTQNLPTPTIANGASYMAATTYTGTGSALTIANTVNGISFQPDFVWVKGRSGATDHALYDSVRGVQKQVESNTTTAETTETTGLTAFGSTGFTVGALAQMNTNAATYVGWQWNAGGSTVTNTSGSISAQVRANPTAGFSVVTYTGTGVSNATVGHGLGVTPSMIILKDRDTNTNQNNWIVWHSSLSANNNLYLSTTDAQSAYTSTSYGGIGTSPTSSVFTLGNGTVSNATPNENGDRYVAYCFAAVAGYSAFGSYTGNGSADGPFVFTGFRPRFVLIKRTDAVATWFILDTSRSTYNVMMNELYPNTSGAEVATSNDIDALSNGFKLRLTAVALNASGGTYVYMAFAENPFKYSLAR